MDITLWSTKCPKCKVLELKLSKLNLPFTLVEDVDKTVEVATKNNMVSAPVLEVDKKYYGFIDAVNFLKGMEEN